MEYVLVELGHAIRINGELAISHLRLAGTLHKDTLPELIDLSLGPDHGESAPEATSPLAPLAFADNG